MSQVAIHVSAGTFALATLLFAAPAFAATIAVQSISPGSTVNAGNQLTFTAVPTGLNSNVTYSISDTFSGSTLTSSNINASGILYWTPGPVDIGTHSITITATDNASASASIQQTITVTPNPSASIQSLSPGTSTPVGTPVTFTVVPSSFQGTSYSFTISDTDANSTVTSANIDSTGHFKWTPTGDELGLHTLTIHVTGGGSAANVSQRIDVESAASAPAPARSLILSSLNPGSSVGVGAAVTATLVPSGFSPVSYYTSDPFVGTSITYVSVNPSGVFSWTPKVADIGTHTISIVGYDSKGNNAATSTIIVVSASGATPATTVVPAPTAYAAPAAPSYFFSVLLQQGSTGPDVTALQQILVKDGFFSGTPSGTYGPLTTAAVKAYQGAHGLSPLGIVGPGTRTALNAEAGGSTAVAPPVMTTSGSGLSAAARQTLLAIAAEMQQIILQLTALANQ